MTSPADDVPRRPQSLLELGFVPQRTEELTGWTDLLPGTLRRLLGMEGDHAATATLSLPPPETSAGHVHDHSDGNELWIDYVAGVGGGFDAAYSVAWLLAQPLLDLAGSGGPLPQGSLLVVGDPGVGPRPDIYQYRNRVVGPYRASYPWSPAGDRYLYALPGLADHADATATFQQVFCSRRWMGGRRLPQDRTYFALKLPHRWWLWGVDVQPGPHLDEAQLRYFQLCPLQPQDRVILCTRTPPWEDDPAATLLVRDVIESQRASLSVILVSGAHHYCRYAASSGEQVLIAGGGGLALHGTHLEPDLVTTGEQGDWRNYSLATAYPSRQTSRRLLWATPFRLPFRQPPFALAVASLYLVLALQVVLAMVGADRSFLQSLRDGDWTAALRVGGGSFILELLVLAMVGFVLSCASSPVVRTLNKVFWGCVLAAAHLTALLVLASLVARVPVRGVLQALVFVAVMFVAGGLVGSLITGAYLAVHHRWSPAHGNQVYVAGVGEAYKSFLRLHITETGDLVVHVLGVGAPRREWSLAPDGGPQDPWLHPRAAPLVGTQLVEAPLVVPVAEPPADAPV